MTFYPDVESIKERIRDLEEEKRTISFQIQQLNEEIQKVQDEIKLLNAMLEYVEHGRITGWD